MHHLRGIILTILTAATLAHAAPCPYADASWQELRASRQRELLLKPDVRSLDSACLVTLLQRCATTLHSGGAAAKPLDLLMEYLGRTDGFSRGLLLVLRDVAGLAADAAGWKTVCSLWEQQNAPVRDVVQALVSAGELAQADSLYGAVEPAGTLSIAEMLEWANLKNALRDYPGAAHVLCGLGRLGERLVPIARSQLAGMLREAQPEQLRQALAVYAECGLALPQADTLQMAEWLARTFGQYGLYHDELAVYVRFESPRRPMLERLLRAARSLLSLKRYAEAAAAARLAWERTADPQLRAYCASVLYESYERLGSRDSAGLWLGRSDLAGSADAARAVAFYQGRGMLARADSLLRRLPAGVVRDSLQVRQYLLAGRADSAAALAATLASRPAWQPLEPYARLWQARAALFSGDSEGLRRALDSLRFEPSWEYAAEVLGYRYHGERLSADPQALADWPAFEYALFRGDPAAAQRAVHLSAYSPVAAQLLLVRLVKAFVDQGSLEQAAAAAGRVDAREAPPEHTYWCAEVLLRQGQPAAARGLLEQLILAHPQSIYASKARLLLARARS